jgi:hypothetical protein
VTVLPLDYGTEQLRFARRPGVELVRAPGDLRFEIRKLIDRGSEPMVAEVTPRADHI